ncbi:rRNA maturation RNase YbeY [Leptospira levettii]|uniref:rRNA maturation RNase YbeY n=1 Tax=Leptospira levettii TaxID=2023178 RepID=UPI000C2B1F96|nr:rRNA maturation RNase YbeY [Leptospira levettii]MCG6149319.1 rRNA maturation RNase YbeY [Leptospira levettii]MCW7471954.1 rRNA maturation RNase YbeY [Leptospira levettii]MCW7509359.1 rRNA maturation RNase YbeY [Leptospira levettii]MCW7520448.1 rRNA maturation RNase YbeY [Leptospira levettii]PJZ36091.1 rRNA maturation RNase YbeY [Leptospira levettii]
MNPKLQVFTNWNDETNQEEIDPELIIQNCDLILRYLAPEFLQSLELSVLVVNDQMMSEINGERRGKPKTTDVLSFPLYDDSLKIPFQILGEIVISMETCRKQAIEIGHSVIDEFYRLLVHGILHLFGYDHETNEEDAVLMRKMEDECLDLVFAT